MENMSPEAAVKEELCATTVDRLC